MSSSSVIDSMVLVEEGFGLLWDNLGWMLSANFLPFLFAFIEDTDPISMMFVLSDMFNILK